MVGVSALQIPFYVTFYITLTGWYILLLSYTCLLWSLRPAIWYLSKTFCRSWRVCCRRKRRPNTRSIWRRSVSVGWRRSGKSWSSSWRERQRKLASHCGSPVRDRLFFSSFFFLSSFAWWPASTLWRLLTLLVHAGLFWCFLNPPNSDMDCRTFNVCMGSLLQTYVDTHVGLKSIVSSERNFVESAHNLTLEKSEEHKA